MRHERTCEICSSTYSYCPNCNDYADKPRWMFLFDSENCKNIYDVVNAYRTNALTAVQAKEKLDTLEIPDKGKMNKAYADFIDQIYKEAGKNTNFVKHDQKKKF